MYKTVGNAYILMNVSSLMKRLSVPGTSYSSHFYGHKKSSEWKHYKQMLLSARILLSTEQRTVARALYCYSSAINFTLISNVNGFLRALYIAKRETRQLKNQIQVTSLSAILNFKLNKIVKCSVRIFNFNTRNFFNFACI